MKVQQERATLAEKLGLYKNRLSSIRAENDRASNDQSRPKRVPKNPEVFMLEERIRVLEEEIIAERNSHNVTKNILKQESSRAFSLWNASF